MRQMSKESMVQKNGGAKVKAICHTCYLEYGDTVTWNCTKSALTVNGAKLAALKQLTNHTDGDYRGHDIGYWIY